MHLYMINVIKYIFKTKKNFIIFTAIIKINKKKKVFKLLSLHVTTPKENGTYLNSENKCTVNVSTRKTHKSQILEIIPDIYSKHLFIFVA